MTTFREAADAGYLKLVALWDHSKAFSPPKNDGDGGGRFWMAGNTVQVAIDYLVQTGQSDNVGYMKDALDFFDVIVKNNNPDPNNWKNDGIWVDDYGWWGIALIKAYEYSSVLGYDKDSVLKGRIAKRVKDCWMAMHAAWDPTRVPNDDPKINIFGGINNSIKGVNDQIKLAGRNCVTNEVYWLLSLLMARVMNDKSYLDPATDESALFNAAINANILSRVDMINGQQDDTDLVLERFKGVPNYTNPKVDNLVWTGDQGLFIGASIENVAQNRPDQPGLLAAYNIADSVKQRMTLHNQVIHEELFAIPDYRMDYAGGKGVFMRNLQVLNVIDHNDSRGQYDPIIKANASAVWNNRLPDQRFRYYWNAEAPEPDVATWKYNKTIVDAVLHASGLSALTAALPWFANQEIQPVAVAGVAGG